MITTHFRTVIEELSGAFERDTRNDGATFYKLRDDAPDWIDSDTMHAVHAALDERLPCDWVYETAMYVADAFTGYDCDDADELRDRIGEIADGLVDVYNADRLRWLAANLYNAAIVDEACEELGGSDADTFTRIGYGQYYAIERIACALLEAASDEADERESSDTGDDD